jgi:hypothetical protein
MAKKLTKKRDVPRTRCNGEWTEARYISFVKSALRGARWPEKYRAVNLAFVEHGINPATGRKCKLHKCSVCRNLFPQNAVQADHIVPVVGSEGFVSWDRFIQRLYCPAEGFRVVCKECHGEITAKERTDRQFNKLLS